MKKILGLCFVIGLAGLVGCSENPEQARGTLEDQAVLNIKQKLKDPDSAKFRNQKGACGEVNAKNDQGEYTGFKKYVLVKEIVIMDDDGSTMFESQWEKHCNHN